ncbi:NADPH-dependent FMN reductase [Brevibacillus sp. TJ4]|uniref:NADPH-dependent FMN reductase n=1 Tax=Brevibacillus sp. TJ4 TaxID=3234853 RepID=UPI0037D27FD2
MKIAAIVGSLRKDSYNVQLVATMQERYSQQWDIRLVPIADLPHYDQDQEEEPPEEVLRVKRQIAESDGVLIATPEFNWSIPGALKNALDWMSRKDKVLTNKPVMIVGASTGMMGTIRAQLHLRQILSSPGMAARVLPPNGNEVLIAMAEQKFRDGKLQDEATLLFLDQVTDRFAELITTTRW